VKIKGAGGYFVLQKNEVRQSRVLHNYNFHDLYRSAIFVRVLKYRSLTNGKDREINTYRILEREPI
jgi:hypothetical protein